MRKSYVNFAAVLALTATVFSCQKAEMEAPQAEQTFDKVDAVLTAVLEPRTKVALDFPALSWEDQDEIAVFDGVDPKPNKFTYTAPAEEGGETDQPAAVSTKAVARPSFVGQLTESAGSALYAVYPYDEDATLTDGKITTTIPHAQVVPEGGNVDNSALLCVASSATDELAFKNVLGLVRVVIPEDMGGKFNKIAIKGANGETVAGTGAVSVSDTPSFEATAAQTEITLTYAEGAFPAGDYYVAVAPVKFENGFSISFTKGDGRTGTKSTTQVNEIVRNGGLDVNDQLSAMTWSYVISTKDELVAWNNNYKSWTKNDVVELGADIDLENEAWTPRDFYGSFDGKNHKIYNFNVTNLESDTRAGFFRELKGNVANLILGSKDGLTYDGKSTITLSASTASSWVYVGSLAGCVTTANVTITNVTNFVTIEVASAFIKKSVVGGIFGYANAGGIKLNSCINNGKIVHNAADATDNKCPIGGIVGKVDFGINITSCENNGEIENNCPKVRWIGGIMGTTNGYEANVSITGGAQTNSNKIAVISKCKNTAAIGASNGVDLSIGGIVGLIAGAQIEECVNTGILEYSLADKAYVGGIAGRFSGDLDSSVSKCENGLDTDSSKGSVLTNGTNTSYVGGIVGYADAYANAKFTFTDCKNYANLTTANSNVATLGGFGGQITASACTFTIDRCYNYGAISNNCTDAAGNNRVAGFVANFVGKDVNSTVITNSENWGNVTSVKPSTDRPWVGGFFGQITKSRLENLVNHASVSLTNSIAKSAVGGIAGNAVSCEVKNADNVGAVTMNKSAQNSYSAGVVAVLQTSSTAINCDNTGKVQILDATANESNTAGIFAYGNGGVTLTGCTNSGEIYSSGAGTNYIGGIAAYNASGTITFNTCRNVNEAYVHCERTKGNSLMGGILGWSNGISNFVSCINDGKLKHVSNAGDNSYCAVGGIIGRSRGVSIENCVNTGAIEGAYNTTNQLANAGGIIGVIAALPTPTSTDAVKITNNVNGSSTDSSLGSIISTNKYASKTAYAGGIVGGDNEGTVDAATSNVITGNKNYGTVRAEGNGVTLGTSGAGGIIGVQFRLPSSFSGNTNYGNVSASGATTVAAGAICGYMQSTKAEISSVAYKGLTVNGVACADATDLNLWLCGSSKGGKVTATYVDAIE